MGGQQEEGRLCNSLMQHPGSLACHAFGCCSLQHAFRGLQQCAQVCMPSHMRTIRQAVALESQCKHWLGTSGGAGGQREACRCEGVPGIPPPRIEHQLKLVKLISADKGHTAVGQASWVVQTLPRLSPVGTRAHGSLYQPPQLLHALRRLCTPNRPPPRSHLSKQLPSSLPHLSGTCGAVAFRLPHRSCTSTWPLVPAPAVLAVATVSFQR